MANKLKLSQDEFDLLNELGRGRSLPEFDCLEEGRLILVAQDLGGFHLEDVVAKGN